MSRYHELREAGLAIQEIIEESTKRASEKTNNFLRELNEAAEERETIKESHRQRRHTMANYKEKVYTEMLSTALKGIYITSLQENMLMNERMYAISEHMVDKFIEEQGGARAILRLMEGKTYLLDTMRKFVEDAAEEAIETKGEDDEAMDKVADEPKEKMLDRLENEEDVDTAVELISDRIANAEEEFIRKNKEDKEKIESIVSDINDRINAVKNDPNMSEETKEEVQKEYAIKQKRHIKMVYENRSHSVFEQMVHNLSVSILKDPELKPIYTNESGKLEIDHIVECTKCMYGFLEFVNTLGLVNVDNTYIEKMLTEM